MKLRENFRTQLFEEISREGGGREGTWFGPRGGGECWPAFDRQVAFLLRLRHTPIHTQETCAIMSYIN